MKDEWETESESEAAWFSKDTWFPLKYLCFWEKYENTSAIDHIQFIPSIGNVDTNGILSFMYFHLCKNKSHMINLR